MPLEVGNPLDAPPSAHEAESPLDISREVVARAIEVLWPIHLDGKELIPLVDDEVNPASARLVLWFDGPALCL